MSLRATDEELETVLGPGAISVALDTVGRDLPPICGDDTAEEAGKADTIRRHEITPLEGREPYEWLLVNGYGFDDGGKAGDVFEQRRVRVDDCTTYTLRGLRLTAEPVVDLDLADGAFLVTATAEELEPRFGAGGSTLTLDEPARVCRLHLLSGDRLIVIDVFAAQRYATIQSCRDLGEVAAGRLDTDA